MDGCRRHRWWQHLVRWFRKRRSWILRSTNHGHACWSVWRALSNRGCSRPNLRVVNGYGSVRLDECATIDCSKSGKPRSMRHLDQGRHDRQHFRPRNPAFRFDHHQQWRSVHRMAPDNNRGWSSVRMESHPRMSSRTTRDWNFHGRWWWLHITGTASLRHTAIQRPRERTTTMASPANASHRWRQHGYAQFAPVLVRYRWRRQSRSCIRFVLGDHRNIQQRCLWCLPWSDKHRFRNNWRWCQRRGDRYHPCKWWWTVLWPDPSGQGQPNQWCTTTWFDGSWGNHSQTRYSTCHQPHGFAHRRWQACEWSLHHSIIGWTRCGKVQPNRWYHDAELPDFRPPHGHH